MSNPIKELRWYALQHAEKLKRQHGSTKLVQLAFDRAKTLNDLICPKCWVHKEQSVWLAPEAAKEAGVIYRCGLCQLRTILQQ